MPNSDARWRRYTTYAASAALGTGLWELSARKANPAFASPFSACVERLLEMVRSGELEAGLLGSLGLFFTGLGLAIATALPFGLLLARARILRIALSDAILVFYAMPMV